LILVIVALLSFQVNVFQDYHDTVLAVGLSHLPGNHDIFSRADIAVGVDVLAEDCNVPMANANVNSLFPAEISFVASISAHSLFNLWGSKATCHLLDIIRIGRASLEAVTSSAMFFLSGLLSLGMFLMLCPCTVSTVVPTIPALEAFLYVQIILHGIGLNMALTDGNKDQMTRVPPKNDVSVKYSLKHSMRWYFSLVLRSLPSAIISHLIYLVALGELMFKFDPTFVEEHCAINAHANDRAPLASIIRCQDLEHYYGPPVIASGTLALASLALSSTILSASFVFRTEPIRSEAPWTNNRQWVGSVVFSIILVAVYLVGTLERDTMLALPWYFYMMFALAPFICLAFSEMVKKADQKQEKRAMMMRRLQFETR
jgi:magnesium-transporting ATPase (P-type)